MNRFLLSTLINTALFSAISTTSAQTVGLLYGVDTIDNTLVSIDPATGATTVIGPLVTPGSFRADVRGLTYDTTYGVLWGHDNFVGMVQISPQTAEATGGTSPTSVSGLAYAPDSGPIYASARWNPIDDGLLAYDPSTLVRTGVGPNGRTGMRGLAFDSSTDTLYGVSIDSDELVTIDVQTGTATSVGPLGYGWVQSLAYDSDNDVLLGVDTSTNELLSINRSTGAASVIGPVDADFITALAYIPIPEPTAGALGCWMTVVWLFVRQPRARRRQPSE